jgi:hypothetical protein
MARRTNLLADEVYGYLLRCSSREPEVLARLREAIHQPIRRERPHGRKDVEQQLEQMFPGATLVGTRGFGDAVIRHMDDA